MQPGAVISLNGELVHAAMSPTEHAAPEQARTFLNQPCSVFLKKYKIYIYIKICHFYFFNLKIVFLY